MVTKIVEKIVVLGTGGTIAGVASRPSDNLVYSAAQLPVSDLLKGVQGMAEVLDGCYLVSEQVAQLDSKDMTFAVWQQLALRVNQYLAQEDVRGIVITHGTDTLEETAYFLLSVLPIAALARKPVVLTCAMRPATALAPDGPQNLLDAVAVANASGACGVLVVCAGVLHSALDVQKVHPYRIDAFGSGDSGPLGYMEEGTIRLVKNWPAALVGLCEGAMHLIAGVTHWPRVEVVLSHAGASGAVVDALLASRHTELAPLRGLVVAGTGNGSLHQDLEAALLRAQAGGLRVLRATRCALGRVLPTAGQRLPDSSGLSPVKARIALMLSLLG
jgi:L-asparaginase